MQGNSSEEFFKLSLSTEASIFLITFTSLQIIIGSISNCIVIITILAAKELRRRSGDQLILNLAVADFLALTTFLPWHIYLLSQGSISEDQQRFYEALNTLVIYYGGNAIFALAIDRFVAIVLPLRHKEIMTRKTTFIIAVLTWAVATGLGTIDILISKFAAPRNIEEFLVAYNLFLLFVTAVLYVIIFYCSLKQGREIWKQRRIVNAERENYSNRLLLKITSKTFLLVFLYYATYLPLLIYWAFSVGEGRLRVQQVTARIWIYSFLFLSSCINPFVYGLQTKRFKYAFYRKIWPKMRH